MANVPDPPPDPPVGQAVLQVSEVRQTVPKYPVVKVPVVANSDVEVEFVVVEFNPVKFWRVDDPVTKRFERVVWPDVTPRVPGKV